MEGQLDKSCCVGQLRGKWNIFRTPAFLEANEYRNIAVIPKSNNVARLKQDLEVNDFIMKEEELAEIAAPDKGLRFNDPGFYLQWPGRFLIR
jgi:hypothetical protein